METSTLLAILKVVFMIGFVAIVTIVGSLPLRLKVFKTNPTLMSMGTTFAGALFINVSILHILPESSDTIEEHFKGDDEDKEVFPLANLLLIVGFMITIFFTRIIGRHVHHHEDDGEGHENKQSLIDHGKKNQHPENNESAETVEGEDKVAGVAENRDALFLTMAMYFHTLFEGIAIGVQTSIGDFLSIAVAIAFHKWADALSMGIHYHKNNINFKLAMGLIIGQAALNLIAIGIGWLITSLGEMTEAVFMAISAGTFLAISTMEMLGEELHKPNLKYQKFLVLIACTGFISFVWYVENGLFHSDDES